MSWFLLLIAALLPLLDRTLPPNLQIVQACIPVLVFTFLGLGLTVVTGAVGQLHLGSAAMMAAGAYGYALLTLPSGPFALGFWSAAPLAAGLGALMALLLALPLLRVRGDYLAVATMGFGEIVKDTLRNLEPITRGSQGLSPLPGPFPHAGAWSTALWYWLLIALLCGVLWSLGRLQRSSVGLGWEALREDELAARAVGRSPQRIALGAHLLLGLLGGLSGALYAAYLGTSGEPGTYDFMVSVLALCIAITGGLGSLPGTVLGAVLVLGATNLVIGRGVSWVVETGILPRGHVLAQAGGWKYLLFGVALIVMMRLRPQGLLPARRHD